MKDLGRQGHRRPIFKLSGSEKLGTGKESVISV